LSGTAVLERITTKLKKASKAEIYARALKQPIRKNTVLYESFSGNGMLCNPEAVFRKLLADPARSELKHIWVVNSLADHADQISEFRNHPRVRFVEAQSAGYLWALATSQYLFNNATFPWQFSKRPGQIYVNAWHGTPLKKMGYDVEGGGPDTRNVVRNFVQADYLVAANDHMRDMYLRAYKMSNIYRGKIIQAGYPRIDRQQLSTVDRAKALEAMCPDGGNSDERRIVLYAPTWKGKSFYEPADDADLLLGTVKELEEKLDTTRFRVMVKVHQVVYGAAQKNPKLRPYLVPNSLPTNVALGLADVLVTDYSSIFFDFLATGKPVVFFIPDLRSYSSDRGLYLPPSELPGPVATDLEELAAEIGRHADQASYKNLDAAVRARYEDFQQMYCPSEDGGATERLIKAVFDGVEPPETVLSGFGDGRPSILIYLGGMASNGITTSALNLLDSIDHERYDVSAFYSYSTNPDRFANARAINANVRLFPRQGGLNVGVLERRQYLKQVDSGVFDEEKDSDFLRTVWESEWRRCFGESQFDYIVDFSGYSPFWDFILLRGKARQRSIWLHNDLLADSQREVNGRKTLQKHLEAVFRTYRHFDTLVSVSPELSAVNQRKLSQFGSPEKFTAAVNTINTAKIRQMSSNVYVPISPQTGTALEAETPSLPAFISELRKRFSANDVAAEAERQAMLSRYLPWLGSGIKTFVSVGRLSPEKNHARLIRAFAAAEADKPDMRLLIVGDGPLRSRLESLAAALGVSEKVVFAGQQRDPYTLMAASDCFVMSSDYEGQPMVILEAKVLGLPIVTTAFGSVHSAVPEGTGMIVGLSDAELAEGMRAFLDGRVKSSPFDAERYNRWAMDEFYAAIGARTGADGHKSLLPGATVYNQWADANSEGQDA
jgi:CDP-glycerol glycerophosphotransferase